VLRSGREFARIALEGDWIDLPVEMLVPPDDTAVSVQFYDFAADRDGLVFGAVPVGVIEERLDPAGLLAFADRLPLLQHLELRQRGRIFRQLELFEILLRGLSTFGSRERTEPVPLERYLAAIGDAVLLALGRLVVYPDRRNELPKPIPEPHE
jgi:hypothetical protein